MTTAGKLCALICAVCGTALHFAWAWMGRPRWLAPLLAVSESIWEHTKLLTVPVLGLLPLYGRLLGLSPDRVMGAGLEGLLWGIGAMVVGFCVWEGAVAPHNLWVGVGDFLLSVLVCWYRTEYLLATGGGFGRWQYWLAGIGVCLVLFTWSPPRLRIFRCPVTDRYGLKSKSPRTGAFVEKADQ